jgi:hypothetical protein
MGQFVPSCSTPRFGTSRQRLLNRGGGSTLRNRSPLVVDFGSFAVVTVAARTSQNPHTTATLVNACPLIDTVTTRLLWQFFACAAHANEVRPIRTVVYGATPVCKALGAPSSSILGSLFAARVAGPTGPDAMLGFLFVPAQVRRVDGLVSVAAPEAG